MWDEVVTILRRREQIGPTLRLKCPRHENAQLIVSNPDDFEIVSPEGGCSERCGRRLECGHACDFLCHAEVRHRVSGCRKPCERGRPECGHDCPKPCSEPCGRCMVTVKNILLPCGHSLPEIKCWESQDLENAKAKCKTRVKRTSRCGHEIEMYCCESLEKVKCKEQCGGQLNCKHHICARHCHECSALNDGRDGEKLHAPCQKPCDKYFTTCSHKCSRRCHSNEKDCGLCPHPCELRCVHSQCTGRCGEYCVPCAEPCTWSCDHLGQCRMPCGAPCDRLPCDERCSQILQCGHRCPSICGEICPPVEFCQECCSSETKETIVDFIESAIYGAVNVDEDPIVVLPCRHFFTRSSMDGTLGIDHAYIRDPIGGHFVGSIPSGSMSLQRVQCPSCRSPISQLQRYNRITKRTILDMLLKSNISRSQVRYIELSKHVDQFELQLEISRDELKKKLRPIVRQMQKRPHQTQNTAVISNRISEFKAIRQEIRAYLEDVNEKRQPQMRVYEMSVAARSRANETLSISNTSWPLDVPLPDIKHRLLGSILELRMDVCEFGETIRMVNHLSSLQGCRDNGVPLYHDVISKCKKSINRAEKLKSECNKRSYTALVVEITLLQIEFTVWNIHAANVVDGSKTHQLRETGKLLLSDCEQHLKLPLIHTKYETAIDRARDMLQHLGPFYQTVSAEERRAAYEAMKTSLGATSAWYYCVNGHPFTVGECGRPMEETRCPECGEPVGGRNHNPAAGVVRAHDFGAS